VKDSTRRTLRTAFAVLGALAAGAPVLVHEAGLDPDAWPWLATVLAVAAVITRVMASQMVEDFLARFVPWLSANSGPPGRHELGAEAAAAPDSGSAGVRTLLTLAFTVLLVGATAATAQAHWPHADRPVVTVPAATSTSAPAPWLGAGAAWDCHGVLWVSYSTQLLVGSTWTPEQDRGRVGLEVRDVSGRSQDPRPGGAVGRWGTPESFGFPPATSGGEGRLRWAGLASARANGLHPDLARVFFTTGARITSVGVPIEEGCPS
jgi:hypothetical protein